MAGGPLVVQARLKTSYKGKDTKRPTQQTVKEPKHEHNTHRQTSRLEKPSPPLRCPVARPPALLILLSYVLPTPHLHIHAFSSPYRPLEKDNQGTECLPPPPMLLEKPPYNNNSPPLPLKCSFHLLYTCLLCSVVGNPMHYKGPCEMAKCRCRLHRFGCRSSTLRQLWLLATLW